MSRPVAAAPGGTNNWRVLAELRAKPGREPVEVNRGLSESHARTVAANIGRQMPHFKIWAAPSEEKTS